MARKKNIIKTIWTQDRWPHPTHDDRSVTSGCNTEQHRICEHADETTLKLRAEIERRTAILKRERAKYPPTLIEKGKGKRKRLVSNPDFTPAMSEKLHKFAFTAEQVRNEIS